MPELWETPVTYGAIGATQAADLLRYPPSGYRAIERTARIGHGDARFEFAWASALSWGIQRGSGFRIRPIEAPATVQAQTYTSVSFESDGTPIRPILRPGGDISLLTPWWEEAVIKTKLNTSNRITFYVK